MIGLINPMYTYVFFKNILFLSCVFSPEFGQNTSDSVVQMLNNMTYRMHRFRTSASPIKGLTADILVCLLPPNFFISSNKLDVQIKTAEIAYGIPTTYERYAPEQLRNFTDIARALADNESSTENITTKLK